MSKYVSGFRQLEYCYHVYLFFGFHKSVECIKRHLEGKQE